MFRKLPNFASILLPKIKHFDVCVICRISLTSQHTSSQLAAMEKLVPEDVQNATFPVIKMGDKFDVMKSQEKDPSMQRDPCDNNKSLELEDAAEPPLSRRAKKRLERKQKFEEMKRQGQVTKKQKINSNPGFAKEYFKETDYYFENGLRKVFPYYFEYTTYAKERWYGRTVVDVFSQEFKEDTPGQIEEAILSGKLKVNGKMIPVDCKIKNGDFLSHKIHRHESHVAADPIEFIERSDDIVVINKPSSIPIHPCGRYRHNSLIFILGKEYGLKNLRTLYRLDRLTSGVFIMCHGAETSRKMINDISQRRVTKEYLCRVGGKFPDGIIECQEPLDVISYKVSLFKVSPNGKPCQTTFERLSYNGKSSVVRCTPHTGRTHQIRVHLQHFGYPIINDPLYNSDCWGPEKGKGGRFHKTDDQLVEDIMKCHAAENWLESCEEKNTSVGKNKKLDKIEFHGNKSDNCNDASENKSSTSGTNNCYSEPVTKKIKLETNKSPDNPSTGQCKETEQNNQTEPSCSTCTQNLNVGNLKNAGSTEQEATIKLSDDSESDNRNALLHEEMITSSQDVEDKYILDDGCYKCTLKYKDPTPDSLVMYLHALRYKGPDWDYSTSVPNWAKENWEES